MSWPSRMIVSLLVIVAAYLGGLIAKRIVWRRLGALARRTSGGWDGEAHLLETIFETVTRPRHWRRPFQVPARAPTSGSFGTRSVFNGQPRSPHGGVDFRSNAGTPVAAPATGVVTAAESLYFTGNTLVIDHGLGLYSLLAHLSQFAVQAGDRVRRGQIVGFVGATGRVTALHLHWSVRLNGARVDPLSLIAATKESKETSE